MAKKDEGRNPKYLSQLSPTASKQPKIEPQSMQAQTPVWGLQLLDFDGPWCWKKMDSNKLLNIVQKLRDFETMQWSSIEGKNSHAVSVQELCKDAQKRLEDIQQDDTEELFSLRLSGTERIWGVRLGRILRL
ncbi:MAG: hypothetical protein ABI876_17160, partial [Bacteroidota bacterium]